MKASDRFLLDWLSLGLLNSYILQDINKEQAMKRIIEDTETTGLEGLLGQKVQIWCLNYIYNGILAGVNAVDIELTDAHIVYETGPLGQPAKDAQKLPGDSWFIRTGVIESYGIAL